MQNSHRRIAIVVSLALGLLSVPYLALSFSPSQSLQALALNAYGTTTPTAGTATPTAGTATSTPVKTSTPVPATSTPVPGATRVASIPFVPSSNGYQFVNWGIDAQSSKDFVLADLRLMFGDASVCRSTTSTVCRIRYAAKHWLADVNDDMSAGHSDGFTTTALRYFKGTDSVATLQAGATTVHDLLFANARRNISYFWALQEPIQGASARAAALKKTPSQVVALVKTALVSATVNLATSDLTTLLVYNTDRTSGHSLLPYAIDELGLGSFKIYVYDSNFPDDTARFVAVNTVANTWSYDLGTTATPRVWSGTATSENFGAIPVSVYAQKPTAPWQTGEKTSHFRLYGHGHLLLTNKAGQFIGYAKKVFGNTITGAFIAPPAGGLDVYSEPNYYVPTDEYKIGLDGQNLNAGLAQTAQVVDVSQVGPDFAVGLSNLSLNATSADSATVSADGTSVAYTANQTRSVDLSLAYDGATTSAEIQVVGADVNAAGPFTALATPISGTVALAAAADGEYNLSISVLTATGGEVIFVNNGIKILAGATQTLDYSKLATGGYTVTLTNKAKDGTITTIILQNQATQTFLPLSFK